MKIRSTAVVAACLAGLLAPAAARDRVWVAGSSTLFPFAAAVAETQGRTGRWKAPTVESIGTGGGFRLFCSGIGEGTPDIIDASRPMNSSETATCRRNGVKVLALRVGNDGMLIVNSRAAPQFSLSRDQLYLALARHVPDRGRIVPNPHHRWKDVSPDLPDLPILVYGPAPNHGTRDALIALAIEPSCLRHAEIRQLAPADRPRFCQTLRVDGAWIDVAGDYALLYSRLVENPLAVGVLGFSFLQANSDRIKAARIDGVAPSADSISRWTYPLSRPLFIYVKQDHFRRVPGLVEFVQEFLSDRAVGPNGYLVARGLMPLLDGALKSEQAKLRAVLAGSR